MLPKFLWEISGPRATKRGRKAKMVHAKSLFCYKIPGAEKKLKDLAKIHKIRNIIYNDLHFDDVDSYNNHLKELKELVNSIQEA
jgi:hypothetical protein